MPATSVQVFKDEGGKAPILEWLAKLKTREPIVHGKCLARILELSEKGNELRRPYADYLEEGVYELRIKHLKVHYRLLYFFFGKNAVALSHGLTKEGKVPQKDIDIAISRMNLVKKLPDKYTADITTKDI